METQMGENHKTLFIKFGRHQATVIMLADTSLRETPISLTEH
jgi:hypothetical protein